MTPLGCHAETALGELPVMELESARSTTAEAGDTTSPTTSPQWTVREAIDMIERLLAGVAPKTARD